MRPSALRKHEENVHNYRNENPAEPVQTTSTEDGVYNYSCCSLLLGLLRLNQNDAIKFGDGKRLMHIYKYMYLFFKVSGCTKYALGVLETLAQVSCLLTPRLAEQLTWNRFVNTKGTKDGNYPMDLDLEHDNRLFKDNVNTHHGKVTEAVVARAYHSVGAVNDITTLLTVI